MKTATSPNPVTRRQFMQASVAASAALAATAAESQAGQSADDEFGGFKLGVQSYSFRNFDLERAVKQVHDLGLHCIEFYSKHVPLGSTPQQIKAVRTLCGDYDIQPVAFGVQNFTSDHVANKQVFEFGKQLGVSSLSANPTSDAFDSLDKLVEEYKIAIAIHPHGPQGKRLHEWYSAEIILEAVKDHHPLIGTCLDTGHLIRSAQPPFYKVLDPSQQVRHMGARNFGMHLKDHDNERRTDVVFGKGVLDVPEVLKALREVKFAGSISIEYEANPDNPLPDMRQCVEVFKRSVRQLT